jgi:putative membrane protein
VNPRTLLRGAATLGVAAVLSGMAAAPALAADGDSDVDVVNTETVQVYTSPTGEVDTQRVYEQLIMTGTGSVDVSNPVSTDGLRNLDGFGGFDVEDGEQVTEMTVDGEEHLRTVSDFDGDLPLDVSVSYKLDGETVEPGDVVGESGELEVLYTVKNITAQPREVSFPDGSGGTTTETVDVPIPMVGSLTTTAPDTFTNVKSEQANMAGDGKGGTKLSFTMTLFPPIGSDTAEFGYTADIVDGVVPPAEVSALPVNPLESPTFSFAGDSLKGGTQTGAKLAEGAATIDSNLLKLRDGAADLLAGLIKLQNGSAKLQSGLADEAAPGAEKLSDGAGQLDDGLGKIADGAGRLFDGTGRLVAGTGDLTDGTGRLADGADRLSAGAGRLDAGLSKLGTKVNGDLATGATDMAEGQRNLAKGLKLLYEGVDALPATVKAELGTNPDYLRLLGALQGMADAVDHRFLPGLQGIENSLRTQFGTIDGIGGKLLAAASADSTAGARQALGNLSALNGCDAPGAPVQECALIAGISQGLVDGETASDKSLSEAGGGLQLITAGLRAGLFDNSDAAFKQLRAGLSSGVDPVSCATAPQSCGIKEGALFIRNYGIPTLVDKMLQNIEQSLLTNIGRPTKGCDPTETLRCGAAALAAGGGDLTKGVDKLVAGVAKLSNGGSLLAAGAGDLADGTNELDAGANKLANGAGDLNAGAGKLADGTDEASDGSGKLAAGADKLADGLADAADGSDRLTDGLGQAREGAPKLVDGAQKLSDKGTSKLVEAGKDTTQTFGQMYATMEAGAERAQTEDMAYGAPEGAAGLTAYSYVIQGDDGETGRNWSRGLAGLALLGLGGGGLLLRRRLI